MELAANERVVLFGLLPDSGDITTMRALRLLKEAIALSEEETKAIDYVVVAVDGQNMVQWNPEKAKEVVKEIEISGVMNAMIVGILNDLEKAKGLKDNHIELWDKFCG